MFVLLSSMFLSFSSAVDWVQIKYPKVLHCRYQNIMSNIDFLWLQNILIQVLNLICCNLDLILHTNINVSRRRRLDLYQMRLWRCWFCYKHEEVAIKSSVLCSFRATKFPFLKSFSRAVCSMWPQLPLLIGSPIICILSDHRDGREFYIFFITLTVTPFYVNGVRFYTTE